MWGSRGVGKIGGQVGSTRGIRGTGEICRGGGIGSKQGLQGWGCWGLEGFGGIRRAHGGLGGGDHGLF